MPEIKLHPDLAFLQWLIDECGYKHPKPIPDHRWAAVAPKIFTHAIVIGRMRDRHSVITHWCYQSYDDARAALNAWDGTDEPTGWIRHPDTGRRRASTKDERDETGHVVPIGEMYVGS